MRPYATDSTERVRVIALLVVLSIALGSLSQHFLGLWEIVPPPLSEWVVDPGSGVFWFGFLFWLTEHFVWRWPFFRNPWLIQIPNLKGTWRGTLRTSHTGFGEEKECSIEIRQTWTRLSVCFRTDQSSSASRAASILLDEDGQRVLRYEYQNQPHPAFHHLLDIHWGTTRLVLTKDMGLDRLEGGYYTNRKPPTYGAISVIRC